MFGKVMSIPDSVMIDYYRLATNVPLDEIADIEKGSSQATSIRWR